VFRVALRGATTLRQIDVAGLQGRSIKEDLARRDFTVNAMALPAEGGALLDPRGGRRDLARKVLRAEPQAFKDDPLRLLRAFRLSAQLGFSIDPQTLKAAGRLRRRLREPAGERLQ